MSDKPVLYGFDGSTYVRTVRMLLHENKIDYDQVPVNVLKGETRSPEHLERHPFGKVPVLDIDGMRLRETETIARYLSETGHGPQRLPMDTKVRAKMGEAIGLIDSYGYDALLGAAGYHLFPDFMGNPGEEFRRECLANATTLIKLLMEDAKPWIAGDTLSLADYFLAPLIFYISLTPDADAILSLPGVQPWWDEIQKIEAFTATEPDLG